MNRNEIQKRIFNSSGLFPDFVPDTIRGGLGQFPGGHHPDYNPHFVHHDPVVIHRTYVTGGGGGGCVGCGVGAAAVAGLVGGAILGQLLLAAPLLHHRGHRAGTAEQVIIQHLPRNGDSGFAAGLRQHERQWSKLLPMRPTGYQPYVGGNGVSYVVVPAP